MSVGFETIVSETPGGMSKAGRSSTCRRKTIRWATSGVLESSDGFMGVLIRFNPVNGGT